MVAGIDYLYTVTAVDVVSGSEFVFVLDWESYG